MENGADAVYVGGRSFSARAYAENFSPDQLSQVADYAQLRGVKLYVALNTLINNQEMAEALEYARFLCAIGVNAVIVQDLGLLFNLRRVLPELRVHASTQMTTHNLAGVKFLESQGVERVIMARELSLDNLRKIAAGTSCALEVFVYGALCICYSGQCLFSSLVGGRSGNRGRCAQPCRLYYGLEMIEERGHKLTSDPRRRKKGEAARSLAEGYLLSPRDLNALPLLPELHRSGVKALKIEGRMKKPEYVATVVRIYRQALDRFYRDPQHFQASPEEWRQLAQIFNRGFTSGYFSGNPGRNLMNYQRPNNRGLYLGRVTSWDGKAQRLAIRLESDLRLGDGIEVWVSRGGRTGLTVGRLEVDGRPVSLARAGQEAVIPFTGRAVAGDRVFKTYDQELERLARDSYSLGQKRIPLHLGIRAAVGAPLAVWAVDPQGRRVEVVSEYIGQPAEKHSLDPETARQQLGRMGNTPFVLESLESQIAPQTLVPLSVLNHTRRLLLEKLSALRLADQRLAEPDPEVFFRRRQNLEHWLKQALLAGELGRYGDPPPADLCPLGETSRPRLAVAVGSLEAARQAIEHGADQVYLPDMGWRLGSEAGAAAAPSDRAWEETVEAARRRNCRLIYSLPRIWTEDQAEAVVTALEKALRRFGNGLCGILAPSLGGLQLALSYPQWPAYADYSLNVFNQWALAAMCDLGVEQTTLSLELTLKQLQQFPEAARRRTEVVVHGSLPVMVSEHCLLGAAVGNRTRENPCTAPCSQGSYILRDRLGMAFPVETDRFCRLHLFNSRTLDLLGQLKSIISLRTRSLRLELRRHAADYVGQAVETYRREIDRASTLPSTYTPLEQSRETISRLTGGEETRGHFFRGVE